jgi:hypothetical protein
MRLSIIDYERWERMSYEPSLTLAGRRATAGNCSHSSYMTT